MMIVQHAREAPGVGTMTDVLLWGCGVVQGEVEEVVPTLDGGCDVMIRYEQPTVGATMASTSRLSHLCGRTGYCRADIHCPLFDGCVHEEEHGEGFGNNP